jgi:hypothetical protein
MKKARDNGIEEYQKSTFSDGYVRMKKPGMIGATRAKRFIPRPRVRMQVAHVLFEARSLHEKVVDGSEPLLDA